ncbi:MAG: hypothetical protein N4A41_14120 [Crocinitomicaceae bacterium]|nr:hypothetical protein [Crocinitomicaceae bacterium]
MKTILIPKPIWVVLLFLFGWSTQIFACYNMYFAVDEKGHLHDIEELIHRPFLTQFNLASIQVELEKLESEIQTTKNYRKLSDYAILLAKGGKVKEALFVLEALYDVHPNEYQIVANLGTTYELDGQNAKALAMIKRGMQINPNSHQGSEWVHVRILETKIALEKDPSYLAKNSVLGLTDVEKNQDSTRQHIFYQLKERFPFCKGPDAIMADIFLDFGDCTAKTFSIEYAKAFYEIAGSYYGADPEKVSQKKSEMLRLRQTFRGVEPERGEIMYTNIKVTGITAKSLMDNSFEGRHKFNYEVSINSLEMLMRIQGISPHVEESVPPSGSQEKAREQKEEKSNLGLIFWIIGGIAFMVALVVLLEKQNKK